MIRFCFGRWWSLCFVSAGLLSKGMCFDFFFFNANYGHEAKQRSDLRLEHKSKCKSCLLMYVSLCFGEPWCSSSTIKPPYLFCLHASSILIENMPQLDSFQMRAATFLQSGKWRSAGNKYFKSSASERGFEFCKSVCSTLDETTFSSLSTLSSSSVYKLCALIVFLLWLHQHN